MAPSGAGCAAAFGLYDLPLTMRQIAASKRSRGSTEAQRSNGDAQNSRVISRTRRQRCEEEEVGGDIAGQEGSCALEVWKL